jgi:Zn-dependent M16 (insulinase) family peptidase
MALIQLNLRYSWHYIIARPNKVRALMAHSSFKLVRTQKIDSLNVDIEEYDHIKTGAKHYHLASENDENVFLVALRTMPMDSSGVAHILEHTALCGSKNYPVRDPFFMMIRRSLNTFMNAFTSSDWTAYPFASKNKKDFNNLLSVYLDAVFYASLNEQDFLQEGHRLEFEDPSNPESPLMHKGVVYNEMKGAMSSVPSQLWQTLTKYLYPTNTYHFNSGGDPESILDLSYDELKGFYKKHYHPSNSIIMTYGDIPAAEHHEKFAEYLDQFDHSADKIHVKNEKRYFAPVRVEESYAFNQADKQTHHVVGWLLGQSINLEEQLEAHFLSSLLLENSSSPLRHALETSDLGLAPSPLCGLEDTNKEMCFVCGIEGSEVVSRDQVEELILSTLKQICIDGVSEEQIESVLHQLELSQREVGGDGYPFGLQIILSAMSACTHHSDPVALLDLDPELERLRAKASQKDFVKGLIEKYLLNNNHRVTLTFKPDLELEQNKLNAEQEALKAIKENLSDEDVRLIVKQGVELKERQLQKDDESILPKVGLEDVSGALHVPEGESLKILNNQDVQYFEQGTNGVSYFQIVKRLPELTSDELLLLPMITSYLTELGLGDTDYMDVQHRQSLDVGGISAFSTIREDIEDNSKVIAYWTLSGKALSRKHSEFISLLEDTLLTANFIDPARIKDLLAQSLSRKEQSISGQGHSLAMSVASSGISAVANLSDRVSGLPALLRLREMVRDSSDDKKLGDLCEKLQQLYLKINAAKSEYLAISDKSHLGDFKSNLSSGWNKDTGTSEGSLSLAPHNSLVKQAWVVPGQSNFCSKVYPTVGPNHPDAPALSILAGVLKNGFLHTAIREQGGAYGGGASQDSASGAFKFYSYRDPRVAGTFEDFDRSLEWFKKGGHDDDAIEQAILGVISSIDKPGSPAGEAKQAFHNAIQGRTSEWRNEFRHRVLKVTLVDLERVASAYFKEEDASYGVLLQNENKQEALDLGFEIKEL